MSQLGTVYRATKPISQLASAAAKRASRLIVFFPGLKLRTYFYLTSYQTFFEFF